MSATMQAIQIDGYGAPEVMHLRTLSIPEPSEMEVVVKVLAAGVGPWDAWIRAGKSVLPQPLPLTPGSDIAGVVVKVGPGVVQYSIGDEIFGVTNPRFTDGYGQYARVRADMIAPKPPRLSFEQAASVPVIAVTAWQMLHDFARVEEGQRVLVLGAAGNVGAYAVQLARLAGAVVVATASHDQDTFVRSLGADEFIERRMSAMQPNFVGVDVVIDTVGGKSLEQSYALVREGGVIVSIGEQPEAQKITVPKIKADFLLVGVQTAILNKLADLIANGQLKTNVGEVLSLADAQLAHQMVEGMKHKPGKILLIP
jgi:NADPH:quinone reductase-like Zn-dependent oxidoreductase